jgi:uncharacterized protein
MFESQNPQEVEEFISSSYEARRLIGRHRELDQVVTEAEQGVVALDSMTLSSLKKEKLRAKDRLAYLWSRRRAN